MEGRQFKKKYVSKNTQIPSSYNQRSTNQNLNHLSLTYVQDSNQNKPQPDLLYQGQFQFDCKQLLHLWLAEVLPGPSYKGLTYDFPAKKIKGNRRQCLKKQEQCSFFLKDHKLKLFQEHDLEHNEELFLSKSISIKIFRKYLIQQATKDLIQNYKLKELKTVIEQILSKRHVCLMSIMIKDEQIFIKLIQKIQNSSQISRSDIKVAQQERIKREKQFFRNQKKQQSFDVSVNFSKEDQGKSSSSESFSSEDQEMKEIAKIAKKRKNSADSVKNDELIFSRKLNRKQFDIADLREWIKNNNKLRLKQEDIQVDEKSNEIIEINIFSAENKQEKMKEINLYFQYEKLAIFIYEQQDLIQKLKDFVKGHNQNQTVCKYFERFIKSNTNKNQIQKLLKQNKLSEKKTKHNNLKVQLISISGIKPNVEKIYNKILDLQNQFKKKNTIIIKKLLLNLNSVEEYLMEKRVFEFVQQIIRQIFQRIKQIKVVDILRLSTKITLELEMKQELSQEYFDRCSVQIEKQIQQKIKVEDIMDIDDLSQQMQQKYLLFQSKSKPSRVVLIEQKDKLMSSTKQILSEHQLKKSEISFKKTRLPLIKQIIENLKAGQSKIMKNISFNYINDPNQTRVQIIGIKYTKKVTNLIHQQLARLDNQILEKIMLLSDLQAAIVEKNLQKFQRQIQKQERLSFVFSKSINIEAIITLGPTREPKADDPTIIYIYKQKCLSFLPKKTTLFFLSELDLNHIREAVFDDVKQVFKGKKEWKQIHSIQDGKSQFTFIYYPSGQKDIKQGIQKSLNESTLLKNKFQINNNQHNHYAFFMPKDGKFQFVSQIINIFYEKFRDRNSKIFIFENSLADTTALIKSLTQLSDNCNSPKIKTKYFINQKGQELCYSVTGENKIQEALKKGSNKIELTNPDLNLKEDTHLCSFREEKMIHILTKKETTLNIYPDRVVFFLNGIQFEMPPEQVKKVEKKSKSDDWVPVSIGAYEIDLNENVQTNLFTGYRRVLEKKQIQLDNPFGQLFLKISRDHKINEVQVCYKPGQEQNAFRAFEKLKKLIKQQQIMREYKLSQQINKQKFLQLKQYSKDLNIQMQWNGQKLITFCSTDKNTIELMIKSLEMLLSQKNEKIIYPQYWSPQTYLIETVVVNPNSKQFIQIQAQFKIHPIHELVRIQNKQVYENYVREKEFLKNLNEGKPVKEMMLYHGTKTTDPKIIYEDRQSCFNVNYTSEKNFMGRGIYFAEQAIYSKSYQHLYEQNGQIMGCMFYCSVLVGESEHFKKQTEETKQLKNSNFKNYQKRLRYQSSSMDTTKSKIYAVYQNRRAYPHYLIKYSSMKGKFYR